MLKERELFTERIAWLTTKCQKLNEYLGKKSREIIGLNERIKRIRGLQEAELDNVMKSIPVDIQEDSYELKLVSQSVASTV